MMNGEAVHAALEREIILGRLKPREPLQEAPLCRRLGVSRTLLRDVFRRLEGAGLVTLQRKRGAVVRDFTSQDVEQVYYVRSALERAAVPLIVSRAAPADLRALREVEREFEDACRRQDMAGMILANLAFHRQLDEVSGNPFLCHFLRVSHLQTHQIRYIAWLIPSRVQQSIREHRTMLTVLARKDAAAFERAVLTHLAGGKSDYQRIYPIGGSEERVPRDAGDGAGRQSAGAAGPQPRVTTRIRRDRASRQKGSGHATSG